MTATIVERFEYIEVICAGALLNAKLTKKKPPIDATIPKYKIGNNNSI